jgi:hypothetical protein
MADVRFLRHLRNTDPNKTTLLRGKKVTAADALQAKLAEAKDSQSSLLSTLSSLQGFGKDNRARAERSGQAFQWITEAKRLEGVAQAEWKEMLGTVKALAERTSASDELAVEVDELCCDAQQCQVQWTHEQQCLNAARSQVRELAAAAGADGGGQRGRGTRGRPSESRVWSAERSGRRAGGVPRRTSNGAGGPSGVMQVLPCPEGVDAPRQNGGATAGFVEKLHLVQDARRQHEQQLQGLLAQQPAAQAAVDHTARYIADLLVLDREERQRAQDEQVRALANISWQGAPQIMEQLFEKVCEVDENFVRELKLLASSTSQSPGDCDGGEGAGGLGDEDDDAGEDEKTQEEADFDEGCVWGVLDPEPVGRGGAGSLDPGGEGELESVRGGKACEGGSGRRSASRKGKGVGVGEGGERGAEGGWWTPDRHARFMKVFKEASARGDTAKGMRSATVQKFSEVSI